MSTTHPQQSRRVRRRGLVALAAVLAVAAIGTATSLAGSSASKANNIILNIGGPSGPLTETFNPFAPQGPAITVGGFIYEPLLQINGVRPNVVYPWLATSYAWSNH